jgi:tetrapyrrole methylase family protein/MazG family protein
MVPPKGNAQAQYPDKSRRITLVGLGPGSPDMLTLGALQALKRSKANADLLLLRTSRHPVVDWLEKQEGIAFDRSFDSVYEAAGSFEQVYQTIADHVFAALDSGRAVLYALPGHPLLGEQSAALLLSQAAQRDVAVEVIAGSSLLDAVLAACRKEAAELKLVDALSLPDVTDKYRAQPLRFDPAIVNIVYQVHDQAAASRVKLALLEAYPPDFPVTIVQSAGVVGAERISSVALAQIDHTKHRFDHLTSLLVPPLAENHPPTMDTLADIMACLRDPQKGCPWDREQTPQTLRKYMIEEAYEVLEAMDEDDPRKYAEELGDLLLQVVFHAQLAREADEFTLQDVIRHISEKLIRRHPHVFGDVEAANAEEVLRNWEKIKRAEPGYEKRKSVLDGVPKGLPGLMRAQEISKRAAKAGFEWETIEGVFEKLEEEVKELRAAQIENNRESVASELGDILFTVVNLARFEKVDAEEALQRMVARFTRRFARIEEEAAARGVALEEMSQQEMERIWREAKREQL